MRASLPFACWTPKSPHAPATAASRISVRRLNQASPGSREIACIDAADDRHSFLITEDELHGPTDFRIVFQAIAHGRPEAPKNCSRQQLRGSGSEMWPGLVEVEREMASFVFHDALQQFPKDRIPRSPSPKCCMPRALEFLDGAPCEINGMKVADHVANQGGARLLRHVLAMSDGAGSYARPRSVDRTPRRLRGTGGWRVHEKTPRRPSSS